jgi:hypothetical protein
MHLTTCTVHHHLALPATQPIGVPAGVPQQPASLALPFCPADKVQSTHVTMRSYMQKDTCKLQCRMQTCSRAPGQTERESASAAENRAQLLPPLVRVYGVRGADEQMTLSQMAVWNPCMSLF